MQAFHPENPLEQALLAASQGGDPDAFLAALREHELLVPAPPPGPDAGEAGETVLGPDAEVALPIIEHQGERFVPVYTSETQLAGAMPGQEGHLRATGAGLAGMWPPGLGMAINPGGDLGVGLPEDTVRALAGPPGGEPVEELAMVDLDPAGERPANHRRRSSQAGSAVPVDPRPARSRRGHPDTEGHSRLLCARRGARHRRYAWRR